MRYHLALVTFLLCTSPVYAGGFFAGGMAEGMEIAEENEALQNGSASPETIMQIRARRAQRETEQKLDDINDKLDKIERKQRWGW